MIDKPILIVSHPRSGSSLVSDIISSSGAFGGLMKPCDKWNAKGYFENEEVTKIVVSYLRRHDTFKLGKRFNPITLEADEKDFGRVVTDIIIGQGYENGRWFYKNPKLCYTWRLFAKSFPEATWIIVERLREDILTSIMRTEFMDAYNTESEWNEYLDGQQLLMNEIKANCNHVVINSTDLMNGYIASSFFTLTSIGLTISDESFKCIDKRIWNVAK